MTSGEKKREVCVEYKGVVGEVQYLIDGLCVRGRRTGRWCSAGAGATGGGGLELGATARGHLGYHFGKPGDP